ncbi:MAG TPA: hypothetical protein VMU06_18975 [Stellaceae bacterium]|nr:hypothetical protein [Stellaceae bacterium]
MASASLLLAALALPLTMPPALVKADPVTAEVLARQAAEYKADVPKTVLELQQFRESASAPAEDGHGRRGSATLVNLNPRINAWFLLTLDWGAQGGSAAYHLENANPRTQTIGLAEPNSHGVRIFAAGGATVCDLWSGTPAALEAARRSDLPYAPLCDGRLYLRNKVSGSQTSLERTTDFLRDHVWGGESFIGFVKRELYADRFLSTGTPGSAPAATAASETAHPDWPRPGSVAIAPGERTVVPPDLGLDLGPQPGGLVPGRWYPVNGLAGIYVSVLQPKSIDPQILASYRNAANALDEVESGALDYLVAFDLSQFELGFALGTDHPRVGWSERAIDSVRVDRLPGPDGINTIAPLVANGMVSPALAPATVATFTGGFKRQHGAFHYGPFAERNRGSHYGFIEQGAVLSKLVPGLATLYVLDDGTVDMKSWTVEDDALLPRVRYARQNGVPLVELDPATGVPAPGALVARWGPGNWSGTADEKLRSLRAGACLQQAESRRFLIYGYFSSATPSAMARVFQAYGCRYAMHLDMNALEHTYLALYLRAGGKIAIQHLVQGMAQVDKKSGSAVLPRFLGYPDDRDFFYLTRREQSR